MLNVIKQRSRPNRKGTSLTLQQQMIGSMGGMTSEEKEKTATATPEPIRDKGQYPYKAGKLLKNCKMRLCVERLRVLHAERCTELGISTKPFQNLKKEEHDQLCISKSYLSTEILCFLQKF